MLFVTAQAGHAQDESSGQTSTLSPAPIWESAETGAVSDLAWGDVDGDLDLAVSQVSALWTGSPAYSPSGRANYLYLNEDGSLTRAASWISEPDNARSIAWADVDRDGDLDADMNGDGFLDLLAVQDKGYQVYVGDGRGGFAAWLICTATVARRKARRRSGAAA